MPYDHHFQADASTTQHTARTLGEKQWNAFPDSGLPKPNVGQLYGGGWYDGTLSSLRAYTEKILTPNSKGFNTRDQEAAAQHLSRLLSSDDPRLIVEANDHLPRFHEDHTMFSAPYFHFYSPRQEAVLPHGGLLCFGFIRLFHGIAVEQSDSPKSTRQKFLAIETIQGSHYAAHERLKVEPTSKKFMLEWTLKSVEPLLESGWHVGLSNACPYGIYRNLALSTPYFDTSRVQKLLLKPTIESNTPIGGHYVLLKSQKDCNALQELFSGGFPKG